ncbi:integral membrane sensor-containing signal transduction histidine kinase [Oleiphilus messinensis]|uniref:histidine kinase n=1 Tax=Oleiphilus messinensis TaxID=141451 RepID=A0A1Y0IC48_9GAMM|nr:histidine kinase [Oleiphilus messinensis]ARU58122.1 integral membrane sensor-containing signal transduction histidine kinase [Oleiphilus messinensis]
MDVASNTDFNPVKAPPVVWRVILLLVAGFVGWGVVVSEFLGYSGPRSDVYLLTVSFSFLHLVLLTLATLRFSNKFKGVDPHQLSELKYKPSTWFYVIAVYINALALIYSASLLNANLYVLSFILLSGAAIIAILPIVAVLFITVFSSLIFYVITPETFSGSYVFFVLIQQLMLVVLTLSALKEQKKGELLARSHQELFATQLLLEETARKNERRKLSFDLHDQMGHTLTAVNWNLQYLQHTLDGELLKKAEDTLDLVTNLSKTLRELVSEMREKSQVDVKHAIEQLVNVTPGLEIKLNIDQSFDYSLVLAEVIFRCCQEAITNVLRHAKATLMTISISDSHDFIVMVIADNGVGMSDALPGNGLTGMKERIEQLNGSFEMRESRASGVCLYITLPVSC